MCGVLIIIASTISIKQKIKKSIQSLDLTTSKKVFLFTFEIKPNL